MTHVHNVMVGRCKFHNLVTKKETALEMLEITWAAMGSNESRNEHALVC